MDNVKSDFKGENFSLFKKNLSHLLVDKIEPIGKKIKELLMDEKYLDEILEEGAKKADKLALKKINEMKTLVSF
jgi:Tryptophanyl-tRNA synthetase